MYFKFNSAKHFLQCTKLTQEEIELYNKTHFIKADGEDAVFSELMNNAISKTDLTSADFDLHWNMFTLASFAPAPFKSMIPDNVRMIRSTASLLRAMGDRGRTLAMIVQARIDVEDFKSKVSVNMVRKLGNAYIQEMRDFFYSTPAKCPYLPSLQKRFAAYIDRLEAQIDSTNKEDVEEELKTLRAVLLFLTVFERAAGVIFHRSCEPAQLLAEQIERQLMNIV